MFETFSDIKYLPELAKYIKVKDKDCFVITQFAVTENGHTRTGISVNKIIDKIHNTEAIAAYGFNCGVGPTHLKNLIETIDQIDFNNEIITALPNAGYPEITNERTVYTQNAEYFSDIMRDIEEFGIKIIGGCCGTTPVHIKKIKEKLKQKQNHHPSQQPKVFPNLSDEPDTIKMNTFKEKIKRDDFLIAVELDPPFAADINKMMKAAATLKETGVDIITISDSPLARERVDSVMVSAKIKRELEIETMPHITCRDLNIIGMKSKLMAAHIENIRNLLLVTGDPVSSSDRNEIESVFNLNSFKLMELVQEINQDKLSRDPFLFGGALNLNTYNRDKEIKRMNRKVDAGASYFLTQPIFDEEVITFLKQMGKSDQFKILGGVMPLVSYKNAQFLNNEIPGIKIPKQYLNRFDPEMNRKQAEKEGILIATEIIEKIKPDVDGIYFMTPFNRAYIIEEIMTQMYK